jgi:hypothetical protein
VPNIAAEKQKWLQLCREAIRIEELTLPKTTPPEKELKKKRGRKARGKALSLLDRLVQHMDAVLAFAEVEVVPFSNNQAERDIRPAKTKQKVAGCFRTPEGADRYARIQGFIVSHRRTQGQTHQDSLRRYGISIYLLPKIDGRRRKGIFGFVRTPVNGFRPTRFAQNQIQIGGDTVFGSKRGGKRLY